MGGKSGKMWQRSGNGWRGRRQKRQGVVRPSISRRSGPRGCCVERAACVRLYAIV